MGHRSLEIDRKRHWRYLYRDRIKGKMLRAITRASKIRRHRAYNAVLIAMGVNDRDCDYLQYEFAVEMSNRDAFMIFRWPKTVLHDSSVSSLPSSRMKALRDLAYPGDALPISSSRAKSCPRSGTIVHRAKVPVSICGKNVIELKPMV